MATLEGPLFSAHKTTHIPSEPEPRTPACQELTCLQTHPAQTTTMSEVTPLRDPSGVSRSLSEVMIQLADLSRECGERGPSGHAAARNRGHTLSSGQAEVCTQLYPELSPLPTVRALLRKGVAGPHLPYKGQEGLLLLGIGLLEGRQAEGPRYWLRGHRSFSAKPVGPGAGAKDIF